MGQTNSIKATEISSNIWQRKKLTGISLRLVRTIYRNVKDDTKIAKEGRKNGEKMKAFGIHHNLQEFGREEK